MDDISDDTISEAYKLLQQCAASESQSTTQSDTYSAFGLYVANELRKYDPLTLAHVKNEICQIIFKADIGHQKYVYYTNSSPYSYAFSNSSNSNTRPSSSSYFYTPVPTPSPLPPQCLHPLLLLLQYHFTVGLLG
ncbi:unnamed protein product [Euphydryas editha]|uniref:Uncharacterized protein n=1 Tax=Euphydryas editha TaxID=104508 RepID=A0AAU9TR37_EUPED|nr:unnamed protein product [Euphydryas editha]